MRKIFSRISMNDRAIPFALSFITIASFGLLIPWLGFYWDDWPVIYMAKTQGTAGFWDFYQYDRPFSAWTYMLFAPLLGTSPLVWQIFTLLLRWLTAVFVWGSLKQVWPHKPHQVFWTALLFAVAPIFTQQPVAVAYSQHWLCYWLFFCSVYLMLRALSSPRNFYLFTALALLASLVQLLTMEYFLGLELLRPVILWFYYLEREAGASARQIFKRVLASGWIYLVLLIAYVIWRMFFLRLAGNDPNHLDLLDKIATAPLAGLLDLVQKAIQDFVFIVTSWLTAVRPADIDLHRPFSMLVLVIAVVTAVLFGMVLSHYTPAVTEERKEDRWHVYAMILGALAILLGTLPVWMIDRQVSVGPLGSRFSLAAIFGVSLWFAGILEWLSPRSKVKITVVCLLIAVAIHTNLHTAKTFQGSWEKQRAFYWQLFWRAPHIQPGTAFIANGEIFTYVGLYSTSIGISLLYPPVEPPQHVPYWFFSYWERLYKIPNEMVAGTLLEEGLRNYSFQGDSKDALLLDFSPESNRCLHFLSLRDENNPDLPDSMKGLLSISNLSQIGRESQGQWRPSTTIFGAEPEYTWCYYFERAELAHQYGDGQEVVRLMEEAKAQGFAPTDMREYLPLLEAYLQTGDSESARTLSLQMARLSNNIDDQVCTTWLEAAETNTGPEFNSAFDDVRKKSGCFD
jgi:hypothetical protein